MPRHKAPAARVKRSFEIEQHLYDRIVETAERDRRSINEQVNHLLADALKRTRIKREADQLPGETKKG